MTDSELNARRLIFQNSCGPVTNTGAVSIIIIPVLYLRKIKV